MASHGNDLPDILLTFLASDRDLLFVANIAAADSPAVRWTYEGLGVIPVSRVRDARALKARGEDAGAVNANAFVRVVDALKQGHVVAIFPEGVVSDHPRLGALRTGAAKMALQAVDQGVPLTMVPIGFQYECAHEPRSGALCVVGSAIAVERWKPENLAKRTTEFTSLICEALREVTRNARTQRDAEVLASIAAAAGAALSSHNENPMVAAHQVQRTLSRVSAADEIFVADSVAPAAINQRVAIEQFQSDALALSNATAKLGARRWSARDIAEVLSTAGDDPTAHRKMDVLSLLVLAPVAAIGWLWHAIPWWASHALAKRLAPRPVEVAALTLVPGLYVMVLWYVSVPLLLLAFGISPLLVLSLFVLQPRLGDQAIVWRDRWRTRRMCKRVRSAAMAERVKIRSLAAAVVDSWRLLTPSSRA